MGPEYWKPQSPYGLKKCDEFVLGGCGSATDDCCRVLPCRYCITFVGVYDTYYGTATFTNNGWLGTINGSTFFAYWERNYDTGECEFIVLIDSYEVYRKSCYDGQSCRDSSDSTETTVGDEYGTLSWLKHELRPLDYVIDYETGCRVHFCGSCECTCRCLCVTITRAYSFDQCFGELCDTAYTDCDAPVWAGTVECQWGSYDLSLALARDEYGNCVITAVVDYESVGAVTVSGCTDLSATIILEDGTEIYVECKGCVPCSSTDNCCSPRCLPLEADTTTGYNIPGECSNPLPECLTVDLSATPDWGSTTCFNGSGTICFKTPLSPGGGLNCWEGDITGTCTNCNGVTFNWRVTITLCCTESGRWSVTAEPGSPCVGLLSEIFDAFSCDPMRITGCFVNRIVGCFTGCLNGVIVTDSPEYELCFDIYEDPGAY